MRKMGLLIAVGLLSYLVFFLAMVPAAKVLPWVNLPVDIRGVSGSLWQGRATTVELAQIPPIRNLEWDLNPLALLMGRVSADVSARLLQGNVSAQVAVDWQQQLHISDARLTLDAADLAELLSLPLVELEGVLQADIDEAGLQGRQLLSLSGQLRWQGAKLKAPFAAELGNYTAVITNEEDGQHAVLSSEGGGLEASGDLRLQGNDNYSANLKLRPRSNAAPKLTEYLNLVSRQQAGGFYMFQQKGRLQDLGF